MAKIRTIVNMPAALTAAAVRFPEMPDATERPAKMRVTTNMMTAPSGVFMISTMEFVPFPKAHDPLFTETATGQTRPDVWADESRRKARGPAAGPV